MDTQGLSKRLSRLFVDGGYKRRFEEWVRRTLSWTVEVVRRPDANFKTSLGRGRGGIGGLW
ncbi:hypothetical protein K649_04720 [Meiothermus ruber DSM 1279]|uniref:Uncharacterized protein n=1 Tax=Meiothermus ruber (strain ATCC 35948 / DSM 1279 / VKM B-1258 / 21) TaxID=504728 RepID=M9X6R8_MEIRD|nr:hypothetical protein K649_04720 [Meiothermus ruber DSM 1279]